jgi:hypothetical protein
LFNSVVFTNLQANEYVVIPTTHDWVVSKEVEYDTSGFLDISKNVTETISSTMRDRYKFSPSDVVTLRNGTTMKRYKDLNTSDCLAAYNSQYVSAVGNVYLVQESPTVLRNTSHWNLLRYRNGSIEYVPDTPESAKNDEEDDAYVIGYLNQELPFISKPDRYPSNGWRCLPDTPWTCK